MNRLIPVLAILAAGTAVAQRSGGFLPRANYGSVSAFGNSGTGHAPAPYFGWSAPAHGWSDNAGHGRGHGSHGVVVAYPVFIGGYGWGYGYGYEQPAPAEPMQPAATAAIEEPPAPYIGPGAPAGTASEPQPAYCNRAPQQDGGTEQEPNPVTYLIATKDHTIISARSYWVKGDTLTYITSQGARKSIPVTSIDEQYSKQLNDEHDVDFDL